MGYLPLHAVLRNLTATAQTATVAVEYPSGAGAGLDRRSNSPSRGGRAGCSPPVAPQASVMIDVGMLKAEQTPDAEGNVIPDLEEEGGVEISSPKGYAQWLTVVVSAAFYNPHRGTCGCICINCNGYSNPAVLASPFTGGGEGQHAVAHTHDLL